MRSQNNKLLRRPRICDTPIFNVSFQFCRRGYCHLGETSSCLSRIVCQNVCVRMFKSRLLTPALSSFWEEREKKRGGNRPGVGAPAPTPGNCVIPTNLHPLSSPNEERAGVRSQGQQIHQPTFSTDARTAAIRHPPSPLCVLRLNPFSLNYPPPAYTPSPRCG